MPDKSLILVALAIIIFSLLMGKFATKTIMNAVRIGAFILGLFALYRNWGTAREVMDKIASDYLPYVVSELMKLPGRIADAAIKASKYMQHMPKVY